jgi:glucose-1-phosphate adenylyltransferase
MLGADYYETDAERGELLTEGKVPSGIGENTTIQYASIFYYVAMAHF